MLQNMEKIAAKEEKEKDRSRMDALIKYREEQDKELVSQKKQQQEHYKNILDNQMMPQKISDSLNERNNKAASVMESGVSILPSNPILSGQGQRDQLYPSQRSVLKGAAMNALNNK